MTDPNNTSPIPPEVAQDVANKVSMPNAYSDAYQTQPYQAQPNTQAQQGYYQTQASGTSGTPGTPGAPGAPSAPIPPGSPVATYNTPTYTAPAKKKSKLPIVILILGLIVLGLVSLNAARGCMNINAPSITPNTVVDTAISKAKNLDFEGVLDTMPPELVDYGISRAGLGSREELVNYLNDAISQLNEQISVFGFEAKDLLKVVSIETKDVSYYSEDGLAGLKSEWNDRIPGFGDTFEEAATVGVEMTGEIEVFGNKFSVGDYIGNASSNVTTVKIDGEWYLLVGDVTELANFL